MATIRKIQITYKEKNIEDYNIFIEEFSQKQCLEFGQNFTHKFWASCVGYDFMTENGILKKHNFPLDSIERLNFNFMRDGCIPYVGIEFYANMKIDYENNIFEIIDVSK